MAFPLLSSPSEEKDCLDLNDAINFRVLRHTLLLLVVVRVACCDVISFLLTRRGERSDVPDACCFRDEGAGCHGPMHECKRLRKPPKTAAASTLF